MKKGIIIILVLLVTHFATQAQDKVSIDEFAWMTGHWVGDGFGGVSEEIWSEPRGGAIVGLYRHLNKEGENNFYEIITIYEHEGSINFRLKHFNPDIVAWEDKEEFVDFPFISVTHGLARFRGLTYELKDQNTLVVTLTLKNKDKTWDEVFTFKRSESFPSTASKK